MEKGLTSYVLNYLLSTCFDSKADMARQLDMSKRALQRVMNEPQLLAAGAAGLDRPDVYRRAYCAGYGRGGCRHFPAAAGGRAGANAGQSAKTLFRGWTVLSTPKSRPAITKKIPL